MGPSGSGTPTTGTSLGTPNGLVRICSALHSAQTGGKSPSARATATRRSGRSPIKACGCSARLTHRSTVRDVAFSPDGNRLLTASHDGTARVWDAQTGSPITPELKHGRWVFHAEFSPDGRRVVTASHDGTARVWDAQTGRPITPAPGPMRHSIAVRDACFSPDGGRVATVGFDGMARIWDAVYWRTALSPAFSRRSFAARRFTPDGSHVLTVGSDSTARIWNLTTVGSSAVTVELAAGANHAVFGPERESIRDRLR